MHARQPTSCAARSGRGYRGQSGPHKGSRILILVGMDFTINELHIMIDDDRLTFWESRTLEEFAHAQNVQPMADVSALFGTWPGEENDGFEAAIEELRHPDKKKDVKS